MSRRFVAAVLVAFIFIAPAFGGLLGSIGGALGIGGDVGKALSFGDSLLPGGGGVTDSIIGAPGKAAFGEAINKWSDANEKSIQKLGETNDRTVGKLLQGLNQVVEAAQLAISSDLEQIDASLTASIGALDDSLQRAIEKLDNSLTDQTQRLDTVFQKQISTFFFLGRVFLTVLILGGFVFTAYRLFAAPQDKSFGQLLRKRPLAVSGCVTLCIASVLLTWVFPDPGQLRRLEDIYARSYAKSMGFEDFTLAQNSASQLTILRPDSRMYRALNLKAAAFRDLVLRPTLMTNEDNIRGFLIRLGQVNEYRLDQKLGEDPDVAAAYAMLAALKGTRELDYISSTIAFQHASEISQKSEGDTPVPVLEKVVSSANALLKQQRLPIEMLSLALVPDKDAAKPEDDNALAFVTQYEKALQQPLPTPKSSASTARLGSLSSFTELNETLTQKLVIRGFYRGLTARYFSYLEARALALSSTATADVKSRVAPAYCTLQVYYRDWIRTNYAKYGGSLSFVSKLLHGPYSIPGRAKKSFQQANACSDIRDQEIEAQADPSAQWLTPLLTSRVSPASRGALLLKASIKLIGDRQTAALDQYEAFFDKLKDSPDPNILASGDAATRQARADSVIDVAELSAILGIYAFSKDKGEEMPAVYVMRGKFATAGFVQDERWRRAMKAFLESRFGS